MYYFRPHSTSNPGRIEKMGDREIFIHPENQNGNGNSAYQTPTNRFLGEKGVNQTCPKFPKIKKEEDWKCHVLRMPIWSVRPRQKTCQSGMVSSISERNDNHLNQYNVYNEIHNIRVKLLNCNIQL